MESVKVLTVGSALGSFKSLFTKVTAINSKHGPFEFLLCAGDFFGENQEEKELEDLLEGRINVPILTYITQGEIPIPKQVIQKIESNHGELCNNLMFIGKAGVLSTSHGLNIGTFGGHYDHEDYQNATGSDPNLLSDSYFTSASLDKFLSNPLLPDVSSASGEMTLESAKRAASAKPLDILLTHEWPSNITHNCTALPDPNASLWGALPVQRVAQLRPRYHFASSGGKPPLYWERQPFFWGEDSRITRFISLGAFGGPEPADGKKQRWFYAFSIAPENSTTPLPKTKPANATPSPFLSAASKRGLESEQGENFIWGSGHAKKPRHDGPLTGPPPGYKCKICESSEHFIKDCPQRTEKSHVPPEGYVCRKCNQPGHYVRECPEANAVGNTGGKKPPPGYVCRACGSEEHFIRDCPSGSAKPSRGPKEPRKEIGPNECWFCLSNPRLTKHLIVSIGSECYLTLPKGQLPPTNPPDTSQVPGGGHALIIPISHYPTLQSIPKEDSLPIISEIELYKSSLRSFYAQYDHVPVSFEVARLTGKGGHAHIQIIPVPTALEGMIEEEFQKVGRSEDVDWEANPDDVLERAQKNNENYLKVDLPDGSRMVHLIKPGKHFNLQFGRVALASLLGLTHRADWKACSQTEAEEKRDAAAFKAAFGQFDASQ
ncbi:hypothetical protein FRC03_008498 [Tulasnella sp. 419]|nr:hypothetical protein FRC03_008498 [Tulasnella sp. 419]